MKRPSTAYLILIALPLILLLPGCGTRIWGEGGGGQTPRGGILIPIGKTGK